MGDRSNIVIEQDTDDRIYLYGHWMGSNSIEILGNVLSRKQRWNDEAYLTRMIFSAMVKDDIDSDSGFGISSNAGDCDFGNANLVVNVSNQTVCLEGQCSEDEFFSSCFTFEDFVKAANECSDFQDLENYNV